jgi:hypothetical protein
MTQHARTNAFFKRLNILAMNTELDECSSYV